MALKRSPVRPRYAPSIYVNPIGSLQACCRQPIRPMMDQAMQTPKIRVFQTRATFVLLGIGLILLLAQGIKSIISSTQVGFAKLNHPGKFQSEACSRVLTGFVNKDLIDYSKLKQSGQLAQAVNDLKTNSPDHIVDNKDLLAFWINAFNILELKAISERYPVNSVLRLGNVFNSQQYIVGGKAYSIQEIYTSKVVPLARQAEPLSIFLVCQGAIGYPPLQAHMITGNSLVRDAQDAAYTFINSRKNVYYDAATYSLRISPFFEWTNDTYRKQYESPYDLVNHFLDQKIDFDNPSLRKSTTLKFDWRLNDERWLTKRQ
jgi:hypothetical protein